MTLFIAVESYKCIYKYTINVTMTLFVIEKAANSGNAAKSDAKSEIVSVKTAALVLRPTSQLVYDYNKVIKFINMLIESSVTFEKHDVKIFMLTSFFV